MLHEPRDDALVGRQSTRASSSTRKNIPARMEHATRSQLRMREEDPETNVVPSRYIPLPVHIK